ncbi:nose resistant to fluoxetine protein 6-like [Drosophila serrata]|uniref:nose resistant to fluoxetine protein 6-like n=1 Tax=Drosophila serrata TaxID=7274 RepID=UPI000A1CFFC0|nr:nose resistant to fluoxetine protein 6-like [Drosophila serrata]
MLNVISILLLALLVVNGASQSKDSEVLQQYEALQQLEALGVEFAKYFRNVTLESLGVLDFQVPRQEDIVCIQDLAEVMKGLSSRQRWALKMIDSWGSVPSGVLIGNAFNLGNFDECLSISQTISSNQKINGKYCFLLVNQLRIATCFPASCSATQMQPFLDQLLHKIISSNSSSISMRISETSCQTSELVPWDGLTILTIVVLSLMACIVIAFTMFDFIMCHDQKNIPFLVKALSARANSRALFRIVPNKSNPNVIECFHGIRCMSLLWVIYAHEYIFFLRTPNLNNADIQNWMVEPFASFTLHGYFAVDSFFVLGGLLVSMIALRVMEKTNGRLNPLLMYLHRIIRLLPVVAFAILVYMTMMNVVSGGPMLKYGYHGKAACSKGWFWTLLFIQNYAVLDICLDHTWYLAVDMQLYLISPLLLIALYKWKNKAVAGIITLIVLLSGCLFATQMVNKYSLLIKNSSDDDEVANKKLYLATHTHAAPWLIGFLFGYFLHVNWGIKFLIRKTIVWTGWILSLAMIFTSIFALYPAAQWSAPPLSTLAESLYYTLTRLAWPLAICWIIFACMQGYGGPVNSFLSSPLWQPLSRLSYSIYIWHMFVQEVNSRNVRTNTYFSNYSAMEHFWFDLGFTVLLSYYFYLIIEAPLCGFDNLLRPRRVSPAVERPPLISDQGNVPECANENESKPIPITD